MSEATLWQLCRRLLGVELLETRLHTPQSAGATRRLRLPSAPAIAAAVTENLHDGDTVGLASGDLATRYLCGVPLDQLRAAALAPPGRQKTRGWAIEADAEYGLLPCSGEEQAHLALGTALSARLHGQESVTMLVDLGSTPSARTLKPASAATEAWIKAAQVAVALQLPLLFITGALTGGSVGPRRPAPSLPTIPVDREDALALYRVIYEAAARARSGGGPTWIACRGWTLASNSANSPIASPLAKMEAALHARKLFDRQQKRQLHISLEKEFARAGWPLPPNR